jgi:hypothetical protein
MTIELPGGQLQAVDCYNLQSIGMKERCKTCYTVLRQK